jgi:hypothetical protein
MTENRMTAAQLRDYRRLEGSTLDGGVSRLKRTQVETPIHKAILELLELVLPRDAMVHHSPNEVDLAGEGAAIAIGKAKALGMVPGWPDLEIVWQGRCYMLEVKAPGRGPSPEQMEVHKRLAGAGIPVRVVRSVTEAEHCLIAWGLIR